MDKDQFIKKWENIENKTKFVLLSDALILVDDFYMAEDDEFILFFLKGYHNAFVKVKDILGIF